MLLLAGWAWAGETTYPFRKFYENFPLNQAGPSTPYTNSVDSNLIKIYSEEYSTVRILAPPNISYTDLNRLASKQFDIENQKLIRQLKVESKERAAPPKVALEVFDSIASHPVVGDRAIDSKYDPDRKVGFCFGRAAYVHLELLKKGVHQRDIAKIFAIGRLKYGGAFWNFHMATMLRDEKNQWWVIDAVVGDVRPVESWIAKAKSFSSRPDVPTVRFYTTDARKFQPAYGEYSSENLFAPELVAFFGDLIKILRL